MGKWIGYKAIIYNTVVNGKPAVKLENWVDRKLMMCGQKCMDILIAGDLERMVIECGGSPDEFISWGGPIAHFDGTELQTST